LIRRTDRKTRRMRICRRTAKALLAPAFLWSCSSSGRSHRSPTPRTTRQKSNRLPRNSFGSVKNLAPKASKRTASSNTKKIRKELLIGLQPDHL